MAFEGHSSNLWSGCWSKMTLCLPSASQMRITPAPLQTQSPANHQPCPLQNSQSPPLRLSLPLKQSQNYCQRLLSSRNLSPTWSRLVFFVEGLLVEFIGMDWSPATPVWLVTVAGYLELILDELEEDIFAGLLSPLVPSSYKSSSSLLVQPVTSRLRHPWISSALDPSAPTQAS